MPPASSAKPIAQLLEAGFITTDHQPRYGADTRGITVPNLYRTESSYPKNNAQRNLAGRTHYVDDDTLHGFHSRVISARHTDGGLLFAIVTSDAKDHQNRSRGFRYVIFDLFGTVLERNPSSVDREFFTSSARAEKAMWTALNAIDAHAVTLTAIENAERHHAAEMQRIRLDVARLAKEQAA
jgi:hypothetical protein